MSTKTDKLTAPKAKAPRRSDAEIAADYAARGEAARIRGIKAGEEYQSLAAASHALNTINSLRFAPSQIADLNLALKHVENAIKEVLAPPSAAKPASTGVRQTTIVEGA